MAPSAIQDSIDPQQLDVVAARLADTGLNLFACLPLATLPAAIRETVRRFTDQRFHRGTLLLIGNAGADFWGHFTQGMRDGDDPIDHFSLTRAQSVLSTTEGFSPGSLKPLYPGDRPLPLQQLGTCAGWHHPSPLGLGIHPQWGLWFAYRALFICDQPLPMRTAKPSPAPCDGCSGRNCMANCPATALTAGSPIDMGACARYRLSSGSACTHRCLARESCPVSAQARYCREQITYHYRLSLETLRRYHERNAL